MFLNYYFYQSVEFLSFLAFGSVSRYKSVILFAIQVEETRVRASKDFRERDTCTFAMYRAYVYIRTCYSYCGFSLCGFYPVRAYVRHYDLFARFSTPDEDHHNRGVYRHDRGGNRVTLFYPSTLSPKKSSLRVFTSDLRIRCPRSTRRLRTLNCWVTARILEHCRFSWLL